MTVTGPNAAPVIAEASLRRGNVRSGNNAAHHLTRALTIVRAVAPERQVPARADSAFCYHENVTAAPRAGAWFSFTIPQWRTVTAAIAGIGEGMGADRVRERGLRPGHRERVSDAEVAETPLAAFASRVKDEHVAGRLASDGRSGWVSTSSTGGSPCSIFGDTTRSSPTGSCRDEPAPPGVTRSSSRTSPS